MIAILLNGQFIKKHFIRKNRNMRKVLFAITTSLLAVMSIHAQVKLDTPPMGWNSFDSYGVYLHHEAAIKNIDVMAEKYLPYGYEYFVIDAGWFGEFRLQEGTIYPAEKHAANLRINEYGLLQPSKTYFPNGLKVLADRAHSKGLKFGVHIMRGIPRISVSRNTKIKGTNYHAQDIADTVNICTWCPQNYGIDMSKPGAQEFYNSFIEQLASWGIDFIKADDIVPFPKEVEALVHAIKQCNRPIVLSLSPGDVVDPKAINTFTKANMLRITHDIWDDQKGIDSGFAGWQKWQGKHFANFYFDMDMIPFGELQIMSPVPEGFAGKEGQEKFMKQKKEGKLSDIELLAGKGWHRQSEFTKEQQLTFITMRALAASPLMIGGDLASMDDYSYSLLTNAEMIKCNQNGVVGSLVYKTAQIEVWLTPSKENKNSAWLGVFNRDKKNRATFRLSTIANQISFNNKSSFYNVWENKNINPANTLEIAPNSVVFIKQIASKQSKYRPL
ncbi:MAG: glycoside hydrolase family 27 protein [Tannerellaceae bacterium]